MPAAVAILREAVKQLPERRRLVMEGRMAGKTLEQVGDDMGITKERVRQLESNAIAQLRGLVIPLVDDLL